MDYRIRPGNLQRSGQGVPFGHCGRTFAAIWVADYDVVRTAMWFGALLLVRKKKRERGSSYSGGDTDGSK